MAYDSVVHDRSGGEAAWVMHHQMQSNPKSPWPSNYNSENNNWNNAMDSAPYSGYPPNYWYPQQSHSTGPYGNAYPPGTEVNGQPPYNPQAMSAFPNGVYNPGQYSSTSMLHPSNPFYCSDQMPPRQPQYHNQVQPERSPAGPGQSPYPVPHCQGAPGYPPGSYPHYGEGDPTLPQNAPYATQQALHSRPQPEAWSGYGPAPQHAPQQQWQSGTQTPQSHYGNHVRPPHSPVWQGPAPPPYEHKQDQQYAGQHPHHRSQQVGPKPRPSAPNNPNVPLAKPAEFSAPPQIYNKPGAAVGGAAAGGGEGGVIGPEPKPAQGEPPPPHAPGGGVPPGPQLSDNPSLARVQQVLARVCMLREDVDEFVGRKSDKSYRYLEELLTKELLVLDSVETQGQEAVRQARREAVQRIQSILDLLENKAF